MGKYFSRKKNGNFNCYYRTIIFVCLFYSYSLSQLFDSIKLDSNNFYIYENKNKSLQYNLQYKILDRPLKYYNLDSSIDKILKNENFYELFDILYNNRLFIKGINKNIFELWNNRIKQTLNKINHEDIQYWYNYIAKGMGDSLKLTILERERKDSIEFSLINSVDKILLDSNFVEMIYFGKKFNIDKVNELLSYKDIIVGSDKDDIHVIDKECIIIDPKGNDKYIFSNNEKAFSNYIIIDKDGNDEYKFKNDISFLSNKIIIDYNGNDIYRGDDFSIASSFYGNSIIMDYNGDDRYFADNMSIAFSFIGNSLIYDQNGNDIYCGKSFTQAVALPKGLSILYDKKGDDCYISISNIKDIRDEEGFDTYGQSFSYGFRPYIYGGIAILYDKEGNDLFSGSYFCQSSSYWGGLSILINNKGDDNYLSKRYSLSCGTHLGITYFLDNEGNDNYYTWGVSLGCGYDYSFSIFKDLIGDDKYLTDWYSIGTGFYNGCGIFYDTNGKNLMNFKDTTCYAYSDTARATCSFSFSFFKGNILKNQKRYKVISKIGKFFEK